MPLRVETYFKTESEIAKITLLGSKTSLPVARVIGDTKSDNEHASNSFLERIKGVTLQSVWRQMSWQGKHASTAELAAMIEQSRDFQSDHLGALYLHSTLTKRCEKR